MTTNNSFSSLKISLISPDEIVRKAYGEVKKPETVNYRTFKPERDGLFCPKIFGPVNNNECACGKYKRNPKHRGIICEKCGVEVTDSFVRRSRIGYIRLVSPVVHIWFLRSVPSRIGILLNLQLKELEMVLSNSLYAVIEPGESNLDIFSLIDEEEYQTVIAAQSLSAHPCIIKTGSEAIYSMLAGVDLDGLSITLREDLQNTTSELKRKRIIRRLRLVKDFIDSGNKPEWMMVQVVPVLPPDLRPLVMLDASRFASSDSNDLYRTLINRNNRLGKLIALRAPEIILRNEKRMLQEAVDSLFDNGRRGRAARVSKKTKRVLKSLSDTLKGKEGRFRQNLLGKRVDYSGRSVIVAGPNLRLHQCGLPKKMAVELFKPYLYRLIELYGVTSTIRSAKRYVEYDDKPEVIKLLHEIVHNHPVLLNRAPTLHRLGIQAFEVVLIDGKAIQLHPLVCTAFNADFDGDQMAVHIPLSIEAQLECYILMRSSHNLVNPANGRPIVTPSKDIVLGLYFLTLMEQSKVANIPLYSSFPEILHALEGQYIGLHDSIDFVFDENSSNQKVRTTVGRVLLFFNLARELNIKFELINKTLDMKSISKLVDNIYKTCNRQTAADFIDNIKSLGYKYATKSGISFGKDDMVIPETKQKHISVAYNHVQEFEKQLQDGLVTQEEKRNKVIDAWSRCADSVFIDMMHSISKGVNADGTVENAEYLNSIYIMSTSGARGSPAQIKQLAGMRGLMSKPSGEIIERPILSNFREGLSTFEYFNSTHGARKGLSDTALKTANSGYLTRRLVDVAQDAVINDIDCGANQGITVSSLVNGTEALEEFCDAIIGRIIARDLVSPSGEVVSTAGEMIDENSAQKISKIFDTIVIRSPITCLLQVGVCAKCYGRDLSTGSLAVLGDAVGVVAAQSIGEPGTQLTMRTFHIGGAANAGSELSVIEANTEGYVNLLNSRIVTDAYGDKIIISRICEIILRDENKKIKLRKKIPYCSKLYVSEGEKVDAGQVLADWDPYIIPLASEVEGIIVYQDLEAGLSFDMTLDEDTGKENKVVTDWKQKSRIRDLHPSILICDPKTGEPRKFISGLNATYFLPTGSILRAQHGDIIEIGDIIASTPRESSRAKDITGGLPRVIELFEARRPVDSAIMSEVEGYVEFGKDYRSKSRILIKDKEDLERVLAEYIVAKGKHLTVNEGDFVEKGDYIADGELDPHDILKVKGVDGVANFLINEVQRVYRLQGVTINNKHIEVILRQMLSKYRIVSSGDTLFLEEEQFSLSAYQAVLEDCEKKGLKPPIAIRILQGITKVSLETESFISAASFQETVKVLIDASIAGKVDKLRGLKENVIVGRLIPAGTGFHLKLKKDMVREQEDSIIRSEHNELGVVIPQETDGSTRIEV